MSAARAYSHASADGGARPHLRLVASCRQQHQMPPAEQYWRGSKTAQRFWLAKRSLFAVLRDRSIEAGDLDTARLCLVALRATDPWRRPEERQVQLSSAEEHAVATCVQRAQFVRRKGQYVRFTRRVRP